MNSVCFSQSFKRIVRYFGRAYKLKRCVKTHPTGELRAFFFGGDFLLRDSPLPANLRGIAPEQFQIVKLPKTRREQMNHHTAEINQDPIRRVVPVQTDGADFLFLCPHPDMIDDTAKLTVGRARSNHEIIGHGRKPMQIQNHHLVALVVRRDAGHFNRQLSNRILLSQGLLLLRISNYPIP